MILSFFKKNRPTPSSRRIRPSVCLSVLFGLNFINTRNRVAPAIATNYSKAGVVVNFVTATGGDVEMLRSIECFYKYVFSVNFLFL